MSFNIATWNINSVRLRVDLVCHLLKTEKIDRVVFDRSGYRFHGRVKAIADTLRDNGIKI